MSFYISLKLYCHIHIWLIWVLYWTNSVVWFSHAKSKTKPNCTVWEKTKINQTNALWFFCILQSFGLIFDFMFHLIQFWTLLIITSTIVIIHYHKLINTHYYYYYYHGYTNCYPYIIRTIITITLTIIIIMIIIIVNITTVNTTISTTNIIIVLSIVTNLSPIHHFFVPTATSKLHH